MTGVVRTISNKTIRNVNAMLWAGTLLTDFYTQIKCEITLPFLSFVTFQLIKMLTFCAESDSENVQICTNLHL